MEIKKKQCHTTSLVQNYHLHLGSSKLGDVEICVRLFCTFAQGLGCKNYDLLTVGKLRTLNNIGWMRGQRWHRPSLISHHRAKGNCSRTKKKRKTAHAGASFYSINAGKSTGNIIIYTGCRNLAHATVQSHSQSLVDTKGGCDIDLFSKLVLNEGWKKIKK